MFYCVLYVLLLCILSLSRGVPPIVVVIIIIIVVVVVVVVVEGLSLLQGIPPTTANKQTQAQKKRGSMARKLLGANAKSYRLQLRLKRMSINVLLRSY